MQKDLSNYSQFIHSSRYARWDDSKKRRETWPETVQRYVNFIGKKAKDLPHEEIVEYIESLQTMPSMRCMMTAGVALERDNAAGFNCSALAIDHVRAFDEILYLLMVGCGVGFSVERQFVNQLPTVNEDIYPVDSVIQVGDSKIGWATALRQLIALLYAGQEPKWDLSKVRPKGSVLKTFRWEGQPDLNL